MKTSPTLTAGLLENLETLRHGWMTGFEAGAVAATHGLEFIFPLDDDPETERQLQEVLDRKKEAP
ncbi:MAG TPA: hypothetical protein VMS77_06140 [Conexivisphaerales archaeon]|nr:hypothetical protein [Conexivisphaerales archaeon]